MNSKSDIKLNPRQEIFAQEIAIGKTQESAYILAGYSKNGARGAAAKLHANASISARVKELQNKNAERNEIAVDDLLAQLEKARIMAMDIGQSHAAVLAIMSKAKLLGVLNMKD